MTQGRICHRRIRWRLSHLVHTPFWATALFGDVRADVSWLGQDSCGAMPRATTCCSPNSRCTDDSTQFHRMASSIQIIRDGRSPSHPSSHACSTWIRASTRARCVTGEAGQLLPRGHSAYAARSACTDTRLLGGEPVVGYSRCRENIDGRGDGGTRMDGGMTPRPSASRGALPVASLWRTGTAEESVAMTSIASSASRHIANVHQWPSRDTNALLGVG